MTVKHIDNDARGRGTEIEGVLRQLMAIRAAMVPDPAMPQRCLEEVHANS